MGKIKAFCFAVGRAFGPVGVGLGAAVTVLSEWVGILFGEGALPFLQAHGTRFGLTLFVVAGAVAIIRIEWRLHEVDELFGNEHLKALWSDGIPPVRDEYIRYVGQGDYGIVSRFWLAGIFNVSDFRGRTDLHVACEMGHPAIVKELLEKGGEPKRPDGSGLTPLMLAAAGGHTRVINILTDHDCVVEAKSAHGGCTALFIAAARGHPPVIDALLKAGADVDAQDINNLTPLMASIAQKNWDVVQMLLENGADLTRVDAFGATLMDYAVAFEAPKEFIERFTEKAVHTSAPPLRRTGGGSSAHGHVRVQWERE